MPDSLEEKFKQAAQAVQGLPKRPDNDTLLKLYALFKQGTAGDVSGKRPGFTDFVGQAKYDAWSKLKGMTKEKAMQEYVAAAQKLLG
jgi:acyl-CoA-binding protein